MTLDEARAVAKLIGFADSACNNCVSDLVDKANVIFPQFKWEMTDGSAEETYLPEWANGDEKLRISDTYLVVKVEEREKPAWDEEGFQDYKARLIKSYGEDHPYVKSRLVDLEVQRTQALGLTNGGKSA